MSFWEEMHARVDERQEREEGPLWCVTTCFRAHTEDEARSFRDALQLFAKDFARNEGKRLDDLMLARFDDGEFVDVVE